MPLDADMTAPAFEKRHANSLVDRLNALHPLSSCCSFFTTSSTLPSIFSFSGGVIFFNTYRATSLLSLLTGRPIPIPIRANGTSRISLRILFKPLSPPPCLLRRQGYVLTKR
ncbi:hypothetical protein KC358_g11 [Hortaea werneckii]|nr:hypothetical protein KC358_g11 [Hortaea werneckii]